MGKSFEVCNIVGCKSLIGNIVSDLVSDGFIQKFPEETFNPATDTIVVLEAGPSVDPLASSQPWRLRIEVLDDFRVKINAATPTQIHDDGTISSQVDGTPVGHLGNNLEELDGATIERRENIPLTPRYFIDRTYAKKCSYDIHGNLVQTTSNPIATPEVSSSYPMSYRLTTAAHGVALYIWDEASDPSGNRFSWFVIQRAVDPQTGAVYTSGKSPVYCVYGSPTITQQYISAWSWRNPQSPTDIQTHLDYKYSSGISRFIVRESDVWRPSKQADACLHTEDFRAIINPMNQVAITEDNKYVITFPNGLNTPRYAYTHELDLIATTSADVVSQWTQVPLTVYGEPTPRMYKSMCANGANNTGLRIMMLSTGPSTTVGTDRTVQN